MANSHTQLQREFIVRKLAAFYTPKDIAVQFAAIFRDTACSENDVLAVDPRVTTVAPELFMLFKAEREKILLDPSAALYADQAARLISLSRQAERYEANNQPAEARSVYRQIAEEQGVISKGAGKPGGKNEPDANQPPVVAITRRIIDPVAPGAA